MQLQINFKMCPSNFFMMVYLLAASIFSVFSFISILYESWRCGLRWRSSSPRGPCYVKFYDLIGWEPPKHNRLWNITTRKLFFAGLNTLKTELHLSKINLHSIFENVAPRRLFLTFRIFILKIIAKVFRVGLENGCNDLVQNDEVKCLHHS